MVMSANEASLTSTKKLFDHMTIMSDKIQVLTFPLHKPLHFLYNYSVA